MVDILESGAETTTFIKNDILRHVFAWSPHNHPPRYVWLKTSAATVKPGMPVIRGTGAGGEGTCTGSAGTSHMVYAISEWDPKQIANCNTTYASGDLIPVIPLFGNEGTIVRNIHITDPNAAIPADSWFQADNHLCVVSDGTGMDILKCLTYIADGSNPTYIVAYITPQIQVAA